jgi:hypothetical protein
MNRPGNSCATAKSQDEDGNEMKRRFAVGLILLAVTLLMSGCITPNMERTPSRWITVIDEDTGKPVPDVGLVYYKVQNTPWIVGKVYTSIPYITNSEGKAHVPSGVAMQLDRESSYELVPKKQNKDVDILGSDDFVMYVRKYRAKSSASGIPTP